MVDLPASTRRTHGTYAVPRVRRASNSGARGAFSERNSLQMMTHEGEAMSQSSDEKRESNDSIRQGSLPPH